MNGQDDNPDRQARLGKALRANLRRRKAQARGRDDVATRRHTPGDPDRSTNSPDQGGVDDSGDSDGEGDGGDGGD